MAELVKLAAAMNASGDSLWVTFDSPQSRSLLAGRRVRYVPYIASRDVMGVITATKTANKILKDETFDQVVSTGAALALAVLPSARRRRIPARYIESVSRVQGPSLTGRIVSVLRLAETFTQHEKWSGRRWRRYPSLLEQFATSPKDPVSPNTDTKDTHKPVIFVTLGTIQPYRFDALVDALLNTGLCNETTSWQLGSTERNDLPGTVRKVTTAGEFEKLCADADVVVTHSGVGTILNLLDAGIHPVVVPRRKSRREHVDDHQLEIADFVERIGVATVTEASCLNAEHLTRAAGLQTVRVVL